MTSGNNWDTPAEGGVSKDVEQSNPAQLTDLEDNDQAETSSEASGDIITLDHLAQGSERVGGMVIRSAQMRKVLKTILRLGPYKATVLIHGESGTGKELVARALHTLGPVPNGPFVTFNCSNLVESLAESQLFGHIKGAFTDAREESIGYFRSANGGTLFLDEIGDLPLKLQPKLLRAVEAHEVQLVGSAHTHKVDIRLVAATNRDLRAMVRVGQFRDDLYYRLNTAAIFNPPLRERREAIPAFIAYYIEHYNRLCGKNIIGVERAVLNALTSCPWPGNVRELAHAIESAVILADSDVVRIPDLPEHIVDGKDAILLPSEQRDEIERVVPRAYSPKSSSQETWPFLLDEVIKRTLVRSLEETDGNRRRAADLLGVSRSTLYRMLVRYGLDGGNHEAADASGEGGTGSAVDSLF